MKIAVIGTGIIGLSHLEAIKELDEFELCAVCDLNEQKVREIADKYSTEYFLDYHDIPEKTDAEAVILNLPHFLHCEATVFFLDKGLNVLVEKPMANTVAECEKMLEAEKRSGKKLAVGHVQRFFNANREVKKIIDSGSLGKLSMFEEVRTVNYFLPSRPAWFKSKKAAGGGIVMNYGAHAIDKLFYITGMRKADIFASCGNLKNDCDIEGHAQIMMKFEDGLSAAITFSGYSPCVYDVTLYFTEGALRVKNSTELFKFESGAWQPIDVHEDNRYMQRQLTEFAKYVRGEESEIPDGSYGRDVIKAIDKIYSQQS